MVFAMLRCTLGRFSEIFALDFELGMGYGLYCYPIVARCPTVSVPAYTQIGFRSFSNELRL